nr:unnamed protein product [Spirometra erinaceieuropaei]
MPVDKTPSPRKEVPKALQTVYGKNELVTQTIEKEIIPTFLNDMPTDLVDGSPKCVLSPKEDSTAPLFFRNEEDDVHNVCRTCVIVSSISLLSSGQLARRRNYSPNSSLITVTVKSTMS